MAQHFSRQLRTPPEPFSEAQDPTVTSGLFWSRLVTYRPLLLLGGLWLALVCVSAIAYHGLMFNEPVDEAPYAEAPLTVMEALPQAQEPFTAPETTPANVAAPQSGTVTLWGLLSLVGLCAFGCFALTQQIKASTRPAKRKKPRSRPPIKASAPAQPPHPKRLAPYSPQRDGKVVPGFRIVEAPTSGVPRRPQPGGVNAPRPAMAQPQARATAVSQPQRPPQLSVPTPPPRQATVVPDEADLPLDWSEGSVAHALDVRQRRSLSSFM